MELEVWCATDLLRRDHAAGQLGNQMGLLPAGDGHTKQKLQVVHIATPKGSTDELTLVMVVLLQPSLLQITDAVCYS